MIFDYIMTVKRRLDLPEGFQPSLCGSSTMLIYHIFSLNAVVKPPQRLPNVEPCLYLPEG